MLTMRFYTLIAFLLVFTGSTVHAQMSRVDGYAVTTFQATWDSLTTETATVTTYVGGTNDGIYSIQLPFDFPYDGVTIPQGTMLAVGANGAISLTNSAIPAGQLIGNSNYPMLIGPFNGDIKQGSDKQEGVADSMGFYQVSGTAPDRVLTIEYRAFHLRGGGSGSGKVDTLTSMQVKLYETTGVIEFIYRDHGLKLPSRLPTPPKVSIGLNGASVPVFLSNGIAKDTMSIPDNDIRFTPGTASVELAKDHALQVYPNPTSDWITITIPSADIPKRIIASDEAGKTYSISMGSDGRVDLSSFGSGSYLLHIETNSHTYMTHVSVIR